MPTPFPLAGFMALVPAACMLSAAAWALGCGTRSEKAWRGFRILTMTALLGAVLAFALRFVPTDMAADLGGDPAGSWLASTTLGAWMAVLVQLLGTVIGAFSARYLQGESEQSRYAASLAGVLAAVQVLLLANHWLVLIAAWAAIGSILEQLLCFYRDRPFALLAAHKKRIADRLADVLLVAAAAMAWMDVGSGSLPALWAHIEQHGTSPLLQWCATCLVLAVILRTALLPVHGWLIQVMEAPTPVSALLHAGVVNLGGFVLIRFAPLLGVAPLARWLLMVFGLATAFLAGLVMLTRISIKVRLAWSTAAQMGFMLLECALGLYTLAALHLIGHSLYKAHSFLASSTAVRQTRLQGMRGPTIRSLWSMLTAPLLAMCLVAGVQVVLTGTEWPWWWSGVLALAWAPMLWLPRLRDERLSILAWRGLAGLGMVTGLSLLACLVHFLPFDVVDNPAPAAGIAALVGMSLLYLSLAAIEGRPQLLESWRRWSYAGFYVDEFFTRLALQLWPTDWAPPPPSRYATGTIRSPRPALSERTKAE